MAWLKSVRRLTVGLTLLGVFAQGAAEAQGQTPATEAAPTPSLGPVHLRQPATSTPPRGRSADDAGAALGAISDKPGEFEAHINRTLAPEKVLRFGASLFNDEAASTAIQDFSPLVPPEYLIQPGDELILTLWGSVDADLRAPVDRTGRISVPRVGTIMVAGVRYADLPDVISRRVAQTFKNFQLSVSLGQLRGMRVYVTGFVNRPGALAVSSLSTLAGALVAAGGPSPAGSLRAIQLRRGREVVATMDMYDLLVKGDRSSDRILQPDDVIHIASVGTQVALIGSVNRPAVYELKPGESVADLLRMAGGFSAVADRERVYVERLTERSTTRVAELSKAEFASGKLDTGDVVRVLSSVDLAQPAQLKNKRVRIEGEVLRPGEYLLPAESTVSAALSAAGGLTNSAYLFGTEFNRVSVRVTQQENYERALRELETDLTRGSSTQRTSSADEAAAQAARMSNTGRLIERLRQLRPSGRVVLEVSPETTALPDILLEDGDRLYIPPRYSTVGVFGSVFNAGSFLFGGAHQLDHYLRLAGGPTKGADVDSVMVVRANGGVVSGRQRKRGWFGVNAGIAEVQAEAGDTIFVPEELDKTNFVQGLKDWTTILYNFGLGTAAIKSIFN